MDLPPSFSVDYADTRPSNVALTREIAPIEAYRALEHMEEEGTSGAEILRAAVGSVLRGRIAVVSAFGAESALLLALVAEIDRSLPVIFLETGKHFAETLAYRDRLASHLGLTDLRSVTPGARALERGDPTGELWYYDQDACCQLRKVAPLEAALSPFDAWISGRKRHQTAARASLPIVERVGERIKLNPLADWDARRIGAEMRRLDLPSHPLVQRGYPSIGCAVCTRAVGEGEETRAGRWAGTRKVECGIHTATDSVLAAA